MDRYHPQPPADVSEGSYQPLQYSFVGLEGFLDAKLVHEEERVGHFDVGAVGFRVARILRVATAAEIGGYDAARGREAFGHFLEIGGIAGEAGEAGAPAGTRRHSGGGQVSDRSPDTAQDRAHGACHGTSRRRVSVTFRG